MRWLHGSNGRYGWCIGVRLLFTCMMWHRHRCKVRLLLDMVDIGTASCDSVRNAFEERNITCQWPISSFHCYHWLLGMYIFVRLCRSSSASQWYLSYDWGSAPCHQHQKISDDHRVCCRRTSVLCVSWNRLFVPWTHRVGRRSALVVVCE